MSDWESKGPIVTIWDIESGIPLSDEYKAEEPFLWNLRSIEKCRCGLVVYSYEGDLTDPWKHHFDYPPHDEEELD